MDCYDFIFFNSEIIKFIYGVVIILICLIIVSQSHRLFKISSYQGLRYFRNAFLFYAVSFGFRFILGGFDSIGLLNIDYNLIKILFEFFFLIAGFFLLYSLLWKSIEKENESFSSILNLRILIFYGMAFIIVILDYFWETYYFMFFSYLIIFVFATIISYLNYIKNNKKGKFLKFYFLAMVLALVSGILNIITAYFSWNKTFLILVYITNITIFLLFLFGVIWVKKDARRK